MSKTECLSLNPAILGGLATKIAWSNTMLGNHLKSGDPPKWWGLVWSYTDRAYEAPPITFIGGKSEPSMIWIFTAKDQSTLLTFGAWFSRSFEPWVWIKITYPTKMNGFILKLVLSLVGLSVLLCLSHHHPFNQPRHCCRSNKSRYILYHTYIYTSIYNLQKESKDRKAESHPKK